MSIITLQASAYGFGNFAGPHGTILWGGYGPAAIRSGGMAADAGTQWALWQIVATSIPPNQVFNGITFQGANVFATQGDASRSAILFCDLSISPYGWESAGGQPIQTIPSDMAGHLVTLPFTKAGFNSNDLVPPYSLYLGFAVNTGTGSSGTGQFTLGSLGWTLYFGDDYPNPAPGSTTAVLTNPQPNYDPGKLYQQGFESLHFKLIPAQAEPSLGFTWTTDHAGIKFSNGSNVKSIAKGLNSDPGNPYDDDTGVLTIAQNVPAGSHGIGIRVSGLSGGKTYETATTLVVMSYPWRMYMEA